MDQTNTSTDRKDQITTESFESLAMLKANPDVIFRINKNGDIKDLHAPEASLIRPLSSFKNANIKDVIEPEQHDECLHLIDIAIESEKIQLFNHYTKYKNRTYYFEGRITKCSSDEVIMIVRDVTSQRNAEVLADILYQIAIKSSDTTLTSFDFCDFIRLELSKLIDVSKFYISSLNSPESITLIYTNDKHFKQETPVTRNNVNGLTEHIIRDKKPVLLKRQEILKYHEDHDIKIHSEVPEFWIGVPMLYNGKSVGAIACKSYDIDSNYTESDLEMLSSIGNQIGLWIEAKKATDDRNSLSEIFEKSLNEIYIFDYDSLKFEFVNKGARQNLGYTLDELQKMTPIDIKDEFNLKKFEEAIASLRSSEESIIRFETEHTRKDGSRYPVEVHLECTEYNREKSFIAMISDISERIESANELRESENRLRSITDNAPSVIIKIDRDYTIRYINRDPLGIDRQSMIGKNLLQYSNPANNELINEKLEYSFNTGESTYYATMREDENGNALFLGTHVGAIKNDNDEVKFLTLIIQNITEETIAKEKVESNLQELKLVDSINQASIQNQTTEQLITLTMDALPKITALTGGRFYLYDQLNKKLVLKNETFKNSLITKIEAKIGFKINTFVPSITPGSMFYDAIQKQEIIVARTNEEIIKAIGDHTDNTTLKKLADWSKKLIKVNSFLIIPLVSETSIFGMITIAMNHSISDDELDRIQRFTNGITTSIAKSIAEEEAKHQREFTENLLNNLPADVTVFTPEHRYIFANKAAIRDDEMRQWIIGKTDYDYCDRKGISHELADNRRKLFNQLENQDKKIEWVANHEDQNGRMNHHLRRLFPVYNGDKINYVVGFGINITERKIAEDQLRASEERYRLLFEQMNEGLLLISPKGLIQMVNPKFLEMTGYSESELIGTEGHVLVDGEKNIEKLKKRLSERVQGKSESYHAELIKKDGDKIMINVNAIPQFDSFGVYQGSMSIIKNTTSEKRLEIANSVTFNIAKKVTSENIDLFQLCESIQNELSRFMETTNFYIALDQKDDTILFPYIDDEKGKLGKTFSRQKSKGLTEYIINSGELVILNGDDHVEFEKKHQTVVQGTKALSWVGAPIYIKSKVIGAIACQSYVKKDQYNSSHLDLLSFVGRQIGLFIERFKNDEERQEFTRMLEVKVHERTAALEISQNENKSQLDTLNEVAMVTVTDTNGIITYANDLFCKVTQFSQEELIGNNHSILKSGAQKREFYTELWDTIQEGTIWKGEFLNKNKSGSLFWVNTTIVPFYDINGKLEKYVSLHFDITEQKTLQERLERSLEKEKELGKLKSRFVATASHQFRTPMSIIQSNSELLTIVAQNANSELKGKLQKATNRIKSEVTRMTNLMNEILILGKISAGKMDIKKSKSDIVIICESICEKYNSIQSDQRQIIMAVQGDNQELNIDGDLIDHAISNLISNAFKYSIESNPELNIKFTEYNTIIDVKDSGIGIPKTELNDLFLPFHRAVNVGDVPGTGLGLTIVKEYVELNGGQVSVYSEEEVGSIFTILLPLQ